MKHVYDRCIPMPGMAHPSQRDNVDDDEELRQGAKSQDQYCYEIGRRGIRIIDLIYTR